MDLNFLLRCALSLAIAAALHRAARPGGRLRGGLALLVTWAICSGLLAFFADDPEGTPSGVAGSSTSSWPSSHSPASPLAPSWYRPA